MSPPPRARDRAALAATLLLAAATTCLRLCADPLTPATFDEVSFVRALTTYDLLAFEPHFPGYPLAVALARAAAALGAAAPYAAAAACLGGVAALRLQRALGGWGGALASSLLLLTPLFGAESARPMADGIASVLLTWALAEGWLTLRRRPASLPRWCAVSLLLGASIAAKPDYVFFASALVGLALCAPTGQRWRRARALGLGLLPPALLGAWALAVGCGGPGQAAQEALRFVGGHLGDWGGAVSAPGAGATPRLLQASSPLCGLAGAERWPSLAACGALFLLLALRAPRSLRRAALVAGLPYALWTLLGQNLSHPRHLLPLLPLAVALIALGVARIRPRLAWAVGLALLLGASSGTLRNHTRSRARGRPVDRVEAWLSTHSAHEQGGLRLYTGSEGRALQWRQPTWDVRRARDLEHVRADLRVDPAPPARVYVAGSVPGAETLPPMADLGSARIHRLSWPSVTDPGPGVVKSTTPPP